MLRNQGAHMMPPVRRILVVDPDSRVTAELSSLFTMKAYLVDTCGSFAEAIKKIGDARYGCVIMEASLPEIMGYEGVPIMRALDPGLEIIMTTDENSKQLERQVRERNIFYFYIKSFDRQELELAVSNAFEKSERNRVNAAENGRPVLSGGDKGKRMGGKP